MEMAKAAIYKGVNKPFEVRELELTHPEKGYAKIELIASGICGTDAHIYTGRLKIEPPKIIGHEFVGRVAEISETDSEKYGISKDDNVIVDIACPCGECALCESGDDANCINMGVTNGGNPYEAPYFHGGYGEYNYSPVENLVKLPKEIDPKMASVFACPGPTAIHGFRLAEQAHCNIREAKTAVVQGTGPVGLFAIAYLSALGVENIIAATVGNDKKREKLARELGADEVIDIRSSENELSEYVNKLSGSLGADLVFEASGSPKAIPVGMEILKNRGVYIVPGQYSNSGSVEIQPQIITFKALRIIGSSQYSIGDVVKYIEFLKNNPELHKTILSLASYYRVEEINAAFDDLLNRKNIKTVLINR